MKNRKNHNWEKLGYKPIPGFPNYVINAQGEARSAYLGKVVPLDKNGCVPVFRPDKKTSLSAKKLARELFGEEAAA